MEKLIKTFDKAFGISSIASPVGSCRDDFLLDRAVSLIEASELSKEDKQELVKAFKENMFHSPSGFDNGRGAGRHYVSIIKEYFEALSEEMPC